MNKVLTIQFYFPASYYNFSASVEWAILVAPIAFNSYSLLVEVVKAVTSTPNLFKNYTAKCPNPPIPKTPAFKPVLFGNTR